MANARRIAAALLLISTQSALAARTAQISIPATSLDQALNKLARQSATEIASTEGGLGQIRVPALNGKMSVRAALNRLLSGTAYRAVAIGPGFRIERVRIVRRPPVPQTRPAQPPPAGVSDEDIVVTASKQEVRLLRFPASIIMMVPRSSTQISAQGQDLGDFASDTPVLQSTELGKGRNKIFIRGIADSSFNGATQSTASVYYDDVQLAYSGPQPDLALDDVERVEVMEGPQGTLYGAGAIGGIIRITSRPVDLNSTQGSVSAGTVFTRGGALGGDGSAMVNLPLIPEVAGLRAVAYGERQGGTINDVRRMLKNVNTTDSYGARAAFRVDPGSDWSINLGISAQRIRAADGQYAEPSPGAARQRASTIAQPFGSDILVFRGRVAKRWDSGLTVTTVGGLSLRNLSDAFDASLDPIGTAQYQDIRRSRLLTLEARVSRSTPNGASWLIGATYLENRDVQDRTFGLPANPIDIIAVTNTTLSTSAFGEATIPFWQSFSATVGARVTHARTDGEPSSRPSSGEFVRGNSTTRLDPTVAFSWLIARRAAVFARFQTGYRTGGLAVARGIGRVQDFRSDTIRMGEAGFRLERAGKRGVSLSMAASYAFWSDIQADLINRRGAPYTLNIGDAKILTIETSGDWIPFQGLKLSASTLFTQNRFNGTVPGMTTSTTNQQLPVTPAFAGNAAIEHSWAIGGGEARAGTSMRWVGRSVLGPGTLLDKQQGGFAVFGLSGGWRKKQLDVSMTIDNVGDSAANRFAFGNPFGFATVPEATPLDPLRMRIGIGFTW